MPTITDALLEGAGAPASTAAAAPAGVQQAGWRHFKAVTRRQQRAAMAHRRVMEQKMRDERGVGQEFAGVHKHCGGHLS
jgi:hypothetical protein